MVLEFFKGKEIEVPEDVKRILESGEQILLAAQEARSTNLINPDTIFVTTHRVIVRKPTSLGMRKTVEDYHYTDIANVQLHSGILRSNIVLKMRFLSDNVEIENIAKELGEKIFKLVQEGISGKIFGVISSNVKNPDVLQQEIIDKIKELAKLKDQGLLTDTEFASKKADLLAKL